MFVNASSVANTSFSYIQGWDKIANYENHLGTFGYHFTGMAALGKGDPSFIQNYREEILAMVRAFLAPPKGGDQYFPASRQKVRIKE